MVFEGSGEVAGWWETSWVLALWSKRGDVLLGGWRDVWVGLQGGGVSGWRWREGAARRAG
ncbi:hypothetical protein U1Q18_008113, partial [Sarracenia purpurea var. burkii]